MAMDDDPRIYFASERTMLAWVRTGIAIVGLGFIVARFGLFLRIVHEPERVSSDITGSMVVGTLLVLVGAWVMAVSAFQHHRFARALAAAQRPAAYWQGFSVATALTLAALALGLGLYLLLSML
jgi:putative membrane protein